MNRRIGQVFAVSAALCTIAVLVARLADGNRDLGRTDFQDDHSRLAARSGYIVASS